MNKSTEVVSNPFQSTHGALATMGVLAGAEQHRAIAETQAAMVIAKRFPRDQVAAVDRILQACTRPALAESALYSYSRGGSEITGPSIRLAECIAQQWGNLQFGIRELEQRHAESEVEAFAWDVETNTRQVKIFQVPHIRYSKGRGNVRLEDPRDIYENVANQGARRLRACILGVIPGDVIEAAVKQCELTLKTKADVTPERIASLVEKFGEFGVTKEQIEKRIQRRLDALTPALMVQLGKIYNSLKDGMSVATDWFDILPAAKQDEQPQEETRTEQAKAKLRERIGKATNPVATNPVAKTVKTMEDDMPSVADDSPLTQLAQNTDAFALIEDDIFSLAHDAAKAKDFALARDLARSLPEKMRSIILGLCPKDAAE